MRAGFFRVMFLSFLALSKTENGITCREGHGDAADGTTPDPACPGTWCEAVNDMQLVLVCSSCEGASNVKWTYNGTKTLNETTAKLSIPPDRVMSSSGCYRCSCSIDEVPFAVKARSAEKPFLLVPNFTVDGLTYLEPQMQSIDLTRSSSGNITVNCTAGGWPTPKVNWSSDAASPVSSDPCVFTWDGGFVLQKVIPRDPLHVLIPTEYYCTLYNLAGTLTASQTIAYNDVSDYFLKPAQDLVAMVEVGREGYCAVYPEPGSELFYTVCLVPTSDAETCPLIANYNASHCCICGSPHCEDALGVNTSVRLTPADANWPGIRSCVVVSQSALTFDCFVQRMSSEVTSLRQFTGSISYYAPNSSAPTNGTSSTSEVDQKLIIALATAVPVAVALILCTCVICNMIVCHLSVLLHREKCRNVQKLNASGQNVERQEGPGERNGVDAAHGPAIAEDIAAKTVDLAIVSNFVPKMAHKWDMIGIQLRQDDLVKHLRLSNNAMGNCTRVLEAAMESGCLSNYETLVKILSSAGVGLSQVAADMLKTVADAEKGRERMQQPADSDLQPPPPPTSLDSSERTRLIANATT